MMGNTWNEKAGLSEDAYRDHAIKTRVLVHGVQYRILDATTSSPTGFQATAYQRIDNGEVEVVFRGTEALGDRLRDEKTDIDMVRKRLNNQAPEADAFTQRVLAQAKSLESQYHHPITVTVAGHSLGGTHAEIIAARYHLGGEAFNSYGAVDLAYGVPEGQPRHAPPFINHVKATDIVSAASRHYGEVRGYATEQDIEALRRGRYLDPPDSNHPANPMITGSLDAHSIANFAPEEGAGQSILTAANAARYERHREAFDHFRQDVMTSRVALSQAWNGANTLANAAHLHGQFDDALGVATYTHSVQAAEAIIGVGSAQARCDTLGKVTLGAGQLSQAFAEAAAQEFHVKGEAINHAADVTARATRDAGNLLHAGSDQVMQKAAVLAPLGAPEAGILALDAKVAGTVGQSIANDLAMKLQLAGTLAQGLGNLASAGSHEAGQMLHEGAKWGSGELHAAGARGQRIADSLASTKAHDALSDVLPGAPRLDQPTHRDHPLFLQAWQQVRKLDAERGRPSDHHSENLAGALTVAAKAQGLHRIDELTLSDDGSRAYASERVMGRTFLRHAFVDTAQAVQTPLESSSLQAAALHANLPPSAPLQGAQAQTQLPARAPQR